MSETNKEYLTNGFRRGSGGITTGTINDDHDI